MAHHPQNTQYTIEELLAFVLHTRTQGVRFYEFCAQHYHTDTKAQALRSLLTKERDLLQQAYALYPQTHKIEHNDIQAIENLLPREYVLPDIATLCEETCAHTIDFSLYIALGIETNHIRVCDMLLAMCAREHNPYIDMLYRLEALSYNDHIPLLRSMLSQGDLNTPLSELQALLGGQDIAQILMPLQTYMQETKDIVQKLQNKQISHQELAQFLTKINFSLVGGGILGSFCAIIASEFLHIKKE